MPNGKILVSGGVSQADGTGAALTSVLLIDPLAPEDWTEIESLSAPRALHSATLLQDGNVLLAGGVPEIGNPLLPFLTTPLDSASVLSSDGQMVAGPVAGVVPGGLFHAATLMPDGDVMLSGGFGNGNVRNEAVVLNAQAEMVASIADIDGGRVLHGAVLVPPDHVVLLGGTANPAQEGEIFGDATRLQGATGASGVAEQTELARTAHTATLLADGNVLVAGGYSSGGHASSAAVMSPGGELLHYFQNDHLTRANHGALLLPSGNVLIIGGQKVDFAQGTPAKPYGTVASALVLDPATGGEVQYFESELFARVMTDLVLLDEQRVVVVGGGVVEKGELRDDVLIVHLHEGTQIETGAESLPVMSHFEQVVSPPRTEHSTTLLDDGRLLVAGGCTDWAYATALDDAYVLSFSPDGTPVVDDHIDSFGLRRCDHNAVVLPGGDVLMAGGASTDSTNPNDPAKNTGTILSGQGEQAGHALMETEPTGLSWVGAKPRALPGGMTLITGGITAEAHHVRRPTRRAYLMDSQGQIAEEFHYPGFGSGESQSVLLTDGSVLLTGGTLSSSGDQGTGEVTFGGRVHISNMTQSLPPGHLWYGAKVKSSTGPVVPGQESGVNFHVPPASCLGSDELQVGWDRVFALRAREDESFYFTAIPDVPGQDLSLYVVMMNTARNGHLCYAGSDLDKGSGAETVYFAASRPETHGAGTYYVVVDSKVPDTPIGFTVYVYKKTAELTLMMKQ